MYVMLKAELSNIWKVLVSKKCNAHVMTNSLSLMACTDLILPKLVHLPVLMLLECNEF